MMTMKDKKGVDISTWQGNINMQKVKDAGYDFVMIRCGWGSNSTAHDDNQFADNVRKAEALGIPWGTYLFSYACSTQEAQSEVEHVDRLLKAQAKKGFRPTMPVAIDIEWTEEVADRGGWNAKNLTNVATVFLEGVKKRGYYPMIYTGGSELKMMDDHIRNDFDCWFAQWYTSPSDYKYKRLGIWQYGGETNYIDGNSIPGVGVIDKDLCYKDYPTMIREGGYNGWPKTAPAGTTAAHAEPTAPQKPPASAQPTSATLTFAYLGNGWKSNVAAQVKTAQIILKALGFKGKDKKALTIDGAFGANTEYAVTAFQKKHQVAADGVVGAVTWRLLTGAK